jgi:signal transduction histidine kinase/ActR/RegA family two-component response regulator
VNRRADTARAADSSEDLVDQLAEETSARQAATAEAELQRRSAITLDQLVVAALESDNVDELVQKLLALFVEILGMDLGVIRIRDGEVLRSRAAHRLEGEVSASFSIPLDAAFERELAVQGIGPVSPSDVAWSEFIQEAKAKTLFCLPLVDGKQVVGAAYLGSLNERSLGANEVPLLELLAARAAAAIQRVTEREALMQAILWRDEALAVVAHDLRNPLSVITMASNTLYQRHTDSLSRRPIERIMRAAERADHLIRHLLDVNAIEGGRFSIEVRRVETPNVILAAIESQQSLAASASVILASDLTPELPPIEADEERLLEVLENLIGNAVKFTNAGGSVTVGALAREGEILLSVKDTGQGIPAGQLQHLFDRFWQARKRDRRGTGLGLTICKAIVEAHGGRIWAESEAGAGTTMFFTIPTNYARPPSSEGAAVANILLVDDRAENLLSLKAILEQPDYRLVTASSGEEALSIALRERFSVALIDIAMPGMDGLEVAVHMKELARSRDVPIIFITAFGEDPQEIHRAYSAGGADYLVKPLDAEIVRKKVAVFVELSRRRHETRPQTEAES